MTFLFLGFLLLALSSAGLVLGLNYAFYSWEEIQVANLATNQEGFPEKVAAKKRASAEQSGAQDVNPEKRITSQIQKYMLTTTDGEQAANAFLVRFKKRFGSFRKSSVTTVSELWKYLLSLTRPLEQDTLEISVNASAAKEPSLGLVEDSSSQLENKRIERVAQAPVARQEDAIFGQGQIAKPAKIEKPKRDSSSALNSAEGATLGMVGKVEKETPKDTELGLFEKLENRILRRLQKSGMNDYDIWLELGDLYVKYNEIKKAMEIYALVLKHSVNDTQKEKAMNKLIGL